MTDERKIITKGQFGICHLLKWDELPDAPKHTDEEFDEMLECGKMFARQRDQLYEANTKLQARIKELEAKAKPEGCPGTELCEFICEGVRRVQKLRGPSNDLS